MKEPNDNPPPDGYYRTGEWRDPNPGRNFNVNPDSAQPIPDSGAKNLADEVDAYFGTTTPPTTPPAKKRSWFARLLCAIGLHTDPVWIAHTKWRCYACQREWRDYSNV